MIRINLLPHREMRRERRKKDFVGLCGMVAAGGVAVALLGGFGINSKLDAQNERNNYIRAQSKALDLEIKEIANLRNEIDSLRARQGAVESLQSNRTIPVHLLDELVRQVPEGVFLKSMRQSEKRVTIIGHAQTNERIAELLRNLATRTPWLGKPELTEIKAVQVKTPGRTQDEERRMFEFAMSAIVMGPADQADKSKQNSKKIVSGKVARR